MVIMSRVRAVEIGARVQRSGKEIADPWPLAPHLGPAGRLGRGAEGVSAWGGGDALPSGVPNGKVFLRRSFISLRRSGDRSFHLLNPFRSPFLFSGSRDRKSTRL